MKKFMLFLKAVFGVGLGCCIIYFRYLKEALRRERKQTQKLDQLLRTANQMIIAASQGKTIHRGLEKRNLSSAAIYGMSEMGERVMEDILMHSSIKLLYGIDRKAEEIKAAIPVYTLEKAAEMEKPEAVILTAFAEDGALKKEIQEQLSCQVITIGELLYE